MPRSLALALLLLAACRDAASSPAPGPRVFVSNENDGTVSVIDARARRVVATIPVGKRPRGLRVSPDGRFLYVALSGSPKAPPGSDESLLPPPDRSADGIGVVDLGTLALVRTLESGRDPESFDLADGGRLLVVSNEETAEASIVDVASGAVKARVPVGREPEGVTTRPGGREVYVASEEEDRVDVVDPVAARVVAVIATGRRPRAIAFTPDGALAFVTNELGASVTAIDAGARRAIATIAVPRTPPTAEQPPLPMGAAIDRAGARLFVTTGRGQSVAIIDVAARRVLRTIGGVGGRPWGIGVAPDGRLYTANGPTGEVAVIDPGSGTIEKRIAVGQFPWGVAIDPGASRSGAGSR